MGRVHFIGGEKGGVGKSLTSRLLAQYFIDNHLAFIGLILINPTELFRVFIRILPVQLLWKILIAWIKL